MQYSNTREPRIIQQTCSTCPLGEVRHRQVEAKARVVTVFEPGIRRIVETAVNGAFATVHVDTVLDVFDAVRQHSAQALLVSTKAIERTHVPALGRVVAECPGVLPVAVVTERTALASERLLQFGAQGVNRILDLNDREGWCRLRCIVAEAGGEAGQRILAAVMARLGGATPEARHFFTVLVRSSPTITTVRQLADELNVLPSTLVSRFYRAGLPSPKRYLAGIRLLYASAYLEVPARSIAQVADQLGYSSPQSFARHIHLMMGMSAGAFRREYPFAAVLEHHMHRLVVPFARKFGAFEPIGRDGQSVHAVIASDTEKAA